MEFSLNEDEYARFKEWSKKFDGMPTGVTGGVFSFIFIPTSIGMIVKVRHAGTGEELDLTDWDAF